jgi:Flp pilus assembly protein TadD
LTRLANWRRYFLPALLIVFFRPPGVAAQNEFEQRLRSGTDEAARGNYGSAMADLQSAMALEPENPQGWYQAGLLLAQMADFRGAEAAFRRTLQLKPEFAQAHYGLGLTLIANPQSKLDWPGAIAEFRETLKYQPSYAEAHNLLGAGLTAEGELEAAVVELQQAVRLKPSLPEAHFNLGIALEKSDRLEEAAKEYQAAVTAKGSYPEATVALAKLDFRLGRTVEAEQQLKKVLSLNPDLADAHQALAAVLRSLGKGSEANTEAKVAKDLSQRSADAIQSSQLSNQGLEIASQGDLAGATNTLRKAVILKPDYGIPHYNLGLILADQGDLTGARREMAKAISLLPGQPKPWLELGRILSRGGELQAAFDAVSWAARLSPSDPAIRSELSSLQNEAASRGVPNHLSAVAQPPQAGSLSDTAKDHFVFATELGTEGDYLGAIGELLRSLSLDPSFADARRQLAHDYEKLGDTDHAVFEYRKLLDVAPENVEGHVALGELLLNRGDAKEAAEEFKAALRYKPHSPAIQADLQKALRTSPKS